MCVVGGSNRLYVINFPPNTSVYQEVQKQFETQNHKWKDQVKPNSEYMFSFITSDEVGFMCIKLQQL